jgi:uncharacterized protein
VGVLRQHSPVESLAWFIQQSGRTLEDAQDLYLARIYRRMADFGCWNADVIVDFLVSGVAFDSSKLMILRTGLERYFARDYVSALYVLVPQVEGVLRRLIGKMGLAAAGAVDGPTRAVAFEEMLDTEELSQVLGQDLVFYLRRLFTDRQGLNLCDVITHGSLRADQAREPLATLVVHVLLLFRAIALRPESRPAVRGGGTGGTPLHSVLESRSGLHAAASSRIGLSQAAFKEMSVSAWIGVITDRIVHEFRPLRVILFGSYARGQQAVDSDVDLLVVLPAVTDRREAAAQIRKALVDIPIGKDVLVTDPEDIAERGDLPSSVLYSALREGRVLYDRE